MACSKLPCWTACCPSAPQSCPPATAAPAAVARLWQTSWLSRCARQSCAGQPRPGHLLRRRHRWARAGVAGAARCCQLRHVAAPRQQREHPHLPGLQGRRRWVLAAAAPPPLPPSLQRGATCRSRERNPKFGQLREACCSREPGGALSLPGLPRRGAFAARTSSSAASAARLLGGRSPNSDMAVSDEKALQLPGLAKTDAQAK